MITKQDKIRNYFLMFQYGLHVTVCFPDVFCPVIPNKAFSLTVPPAPLPNFFFLFEHETYQPLLLYNGDKKASNIIHYCLHI